MSTCADCGEIIDVRCAHRLLQSERAKREETERQFQAKVAEIGTLDDKLAAERANVEQLRRILGWYVARVANWAEHAPVLTDSERDVLSQSPTEKT